MKSVVGIDYHPSTVHSEWHGEGMKAAAGLLSTACQLAIALWEIRVRFGISNFI